jgi:hypothetical protein
MPRRSPGPSASEPRELDAKSGWKPPRQKRWPERAGDAARGLEDLFDPAGG